MQPEAELLAPVGTWDMLEAVIEAGADAVYLGGKKFNMRLHRQEANLDDRQLAKAVQYAHDRKVKLYVTVNNLMTDEELKDARTYLQFLQEIRPDALIIQDLGLLKLLREMDITLPLHASVMMNVHNLEMVSLLQKYGITRVIFSRELNLEQIRQICHFTGVEAEYFVHGDMCVAHSGQCLHSGIVFGQSSSRGRCLKPCRWPYRLVDRATGRELACNDPGPYKLAIKDMCLYDHLPELIQAGIYSFKIEGRMRTADFMRQITGLYRRALDRYLADPTGYRREEEDWQKLHSLRVRDFTTCYAFKNPGGSSIGYDGKREPRFFSQAVPESGLPAQKSLPAAGPVPSLAVKPQLSVRVGNYAAFREALAAGADCIYIGGEAFPPDSPWPLAKIAQAVRESEGKAKVIVTAPRITMQRELNEVKRLLCRLQAVNPAGFLLTHAGLLEAASGSCSLPLYADFSFNCFNSHSASLLHELGIVQTTVSLEATYNQAAAMIKQSPVAMEWCVHGGIPAMILEHCIPAAMFAGGTREESCPRPCRNHDIGLLDTAGQIHAVFTDQYCRNHILLGRDLCLLPFLPDICATGVHSLRIEGQYYNPSAVGIITRIYRTQLDSLWADPAAYQAPDSLFAELRAAGSRELGIGVFAHDESK